MLVKAHLVGASGNPFVLVLRNVEDVQKALDELYRINLELKRKGEHAPSLGEMLRESYRYVNDPGELWLNIRQLKSLKKGDCEDYTAAIAAADEKRGARPFCFQASNNVVHCVVKYPDGTTLDPSALLGMKLPSKKRGRNV